MTTATATPIRFEETVTYEAIPVIDTPEDDIRLFLKGTGYVYTTRLDAAFVVGIIHPEGTETFDAARKMVTKDHYLVKRNGQLMPPRNASWFAQHGIIL